MSRKKKLKKISFGEFRLSSTSRRFVNKVLDSNWITMGNVTKKLESKWAKLFGYQYARAVNSGTSALIASFLTLYEFGAKEGDEIICPALSFIATANAIRAAGFKPVFVDVEMETLNINPELIKEKMSARTVAICAVNLMGRPCELDKIQNIGILNDLPIIIDNAEGYGCKFKNNYSLDYGMIEISSHFAAHIMCAGELGLCSTNDIILANLIESIRSHGRPVGSSYFDHQRFGLNLKTTDLHSAIGLGELGRFWRSFNKRKEHIRALIEHTEKYKEFAHFNLSDDDTYVSAPHAFCITMKPKYEYKNASNSERSIERLKEILDNNNIEWKRTFGSMPTQHRCFEYLGHKLGDFPVAEYIGDNSIHLSCSQYLKPADLERIKVALDMFFFPLLTDKAVDEVFGNESLLFEASSPFGSDHQKEYL